MNRAAVGLILLAPFGCGGSGGEGALVQGAISYQGRAIVSGTINFFPAGGKPLGGPIRPDGTYEFRLPVGEYRVAIRESANLPDGWQEGDPVPTPTGDELPGSYGRPSTSQLSVTVSEGGPPVTEDFHLD